MITIQVPSPLTWHTSQIIVDVFFIVLNVCVSNQSHGHWLFFNVLHILITMTLKLIEEFRFSIGTLMDDDYVDILVLSFLTFNIKKMGVLDTFLSL